MDAAPRGILMADGDDGDGYMVMMMIRILVGCWPHDLWRLISEHKSGLCSRTMGACPLPVISQPRYSFLRACY